MLRYALAATFAGCASAASGDDECKLGGVGLRVIAHEVIVNFVPTSDSQMLEQLRGKLSRGMASGDHAEVDGAAGMLLLRTRSPDVRDRAIDDASAFVVIRSIQPNFRWRPASTAGPAPEPPLDRDWALRRIHAYAARRRSTGSHEIVVAVVDTGIERVHDDFADRTGFTPRLWENAAELRGRPNIDDDRNGVADDSYGASFHGDKEGTDIDDESGHGTLVAGIIGGRTGSQRPGGVAARLRLMPVRVFDKDNEGSSWSIARGIRYATRSGAEIINLSLQTDCDGDDAVKWAVQHARRQGRAIVAAAGNDPNDGRNIDVKPSYPASLRGSSLLVVGGTDDWDWRLRISHFGRTAVDLGAPGLEISGPWRGNTTHTLSGTSFAAPLATGGLVLLAPLTPDWSWRQRIGYLLASAQPHSQLATDFASGGLLDLDRATTAPATVLAPASADLWHAGEIRHVSWTPRPRQGACRRFDVWLTDARNIMQATLLAGRVPVTDGEVEVRVPMQSAPDVQLRLTCAGTALHAFSEPFKLE